MDAGVILIIIFGSAAIVIALILARVAKRAKRAKRLRFIETYMFPQKVSQQVKDTYPHLTDSDVAKVIDGLKEWFCICYMAGKRPVSMPSQVVDVAWHEMILFTKEYQRFCNKALGYFLHHTPSEAMKSDRSAQQGIKLAWKLSCLRKGVSTDNPKRLPILFSLDARLKIPDGFKYSLNCNGPRSKGHCATHIGCASFSPGCASGYSGDCANADANGGGDSISSCGSSCGSSGCGGGS
ncbi:glycine-rich domain-containing protein [Flocculibacter collagenilyticus]|uniref:glycine-rich domain-containing protein n=1 Tax=Flocculibacter collagenilyticus TaxID=2744479 RepID=UPI001F2060BA|nr:hypothetical protein [Flocculibacter collagenilyticus]